MNRNVFAAAFLSGALIVVWVAVGFIGSNSLALVMTVIIAAVYATGALEILNFRRATTGLATALQAIPPNLGRLDDWLDKLPASLQNPVRLRIEGARIALPGPALAPYLIGLLVMLGMLGTFLGMVVTLNGAVFALEGTTDLQTIRTALAAPIRGLGLAFGTSVAGVAASAMLGLMSALSRRERMLTAQRLDTKLATELRGFSLTHQRQEAYRALRHQADALPLVVDKLHALMSQMERREQHLNERLLGNQESFHREVKAVYTELAGSVEKSLRESLNDSARIAGESITPVVEAALAGVAREAKSMHERMADSARIQLEGLTTSFGATASAVAETWSAAHATHQSTSESLVNGLNHAMTRFTETFERRSESLLAAVEQALSAAQAEQGAAERQRQEALTRSLEAMAGALSAEWQRAGAATLAQQSQICATLETTARDITAEVQTSTRHTLDEMTRLLNGSEALLRARIESEANWTTEHGERMDQMHRLWRTELAALRDEEARRGIAAVDRLADLQTALTSHLSTLGAALEDPITRLMQTAAEAPRAAAEVIGQMRQQMSASIARDNEVLEERSRILETLTLLLDSIDQASARQRAAIDALVLSSRESLEGVGTRFAEQVGAESSRLEEIAAHVTSSAVEVSTLSEAFGFAVQSFSEANEKLIANLQRIEAAMDKSMLRSDEQLAYYVAQAREIIDLSIMSQKQVFDDLRRLTDQQAILAEAAA